MDLSDEFAKRKISDLIGKMEALITHFEENHIKMMKKLRKAYLCMLCDWES